MIQREHNQGLPRVLDPLSKFHLTKMAALTQILAKNFF